MKYTEREDDFIKANYKTMSLSDMAKFLNRTEWSIKRRANRIRCYRISPKTIFAGSLDGEEWRDIPGYEKLYKVSNYGRILAERTITSQGRRINQIVMAQDTDKDGYKKVGLRKCGKSKKFFVHRLVATAFIDNENDYPVINHIDGNPANNRFDNLEWCTVKYNVNFGDRAKKYSAKTRGEKHYNSILTEHDVLIIRETYIPGDPNYGQAAIARKYGVSRGTIESIVRNKSWKYLL